MGFTTHLHHITNDVIVMLPQYRGVPMGFAQVRDFPRDTGEVRMEGVKNCCLVDSSEIDEAGMPVDTFAGDVHQRRILQSMPADLLRKRAARNAAPVGMPGDVQPRKAIGMLAEHRCRSLVLRQAQRAHVPIG
ncbi:hypothetical protein D9M70_476780 [compost metagenome]